MASAHQLMSARRRGPRSRVSNHTAGTGRIASVAAALTPPAHSSATPDRAAARRGDPPRAPSTSGLTTQGNTAIGSSSDEIEVSSLSVRGASAYTRPAATRGQNPRTPSRPLSR